MNKEVFGKGCGKRIDIEFHKEIICGDDIQFNVKPNIMTNLCPRCFKENKK